jgi:hypothetical protein
MSLLLSLVLSAAVLDPNPKDARRLQPRQVTASSFLKNGWNRAEQNYLPPYVADDNPDTAWVEGVPGYGEGQSLTWLGPTLKQVKQFRIFIRNGFQKSRALHAANGRPKRIQLQPLLKTEVTEVAAGRPVTVTLSDELGWQEVVLPTEPHVTGFRLTVLSVYPGAKFQDTALSDVRVYVQGDDKYNQAAELASMETIRQFVEERQRAAALQGDEGSIELAPAYRVEVHRASRTAEEGAEDGSTVSFSELAKAHQADVFGKRWKRVWALAQAMDAIEPFAETAFKEVTTGAPKGWTRVTARPQHAKPSAAAVALGESPDRELAYAVAYLASKDVLLFQDTLTPAQLKGRVKAAQRQEKADAAWCTKAAEAWAARTHKADPEQDSGLLVQKFYEDHLSRCEQLIALSPSPASRTDEVAAEIHGGSFLRGDFEHPSQLLVLHAFYVSDRNFVGQSMTRMLVAYEGNLASVVATFNSEGDEGEEDAPVAFIHLLEWKDLGKGRHRLVGITSVSQDGTWRLTAVD